MKVSLQRAAVENLSDDEDYQERDDEKPQVVQIREGDLTEEEAARLAKGEKFHRIILTKLQLKVFQIFLVQIS